LTINLDVATLLQANLSTSLGLLPNATIFEICAAIDAGGEVNIDDILSALLDEIDPIVRAEIEAQITAIATVIAATGVDVDPILIGTILDSINYTAIEEDILLDIEASLDLFNDCRGVVTIDSLVSARQLPSLSSTMQQNSQVLSFGDSRLQLH
jgi:hypothetical protein